MSQDWTKFNTGSTPLDIQHYVKTQAGRLKDNNFYQHVEVLQAAVRSYWDESPDNGRLANFQHWKESHCSDLLDSVPWLTGFVTDDGNLAPAVSALSASENSCTRLLLRLSVLLSNAIIMSDWKLKALEPLKRFDKRSITSSSSDYSAITVTRLIRRGLECKHMVNYHLWDQLQESVSSYTTHRNFQTLASKVATFCLEAGCPVVKYDPSDDIYSLRKHLLSHGSGAREAELREEITRLNNVNRSQQRIITNLAFRNLLEMLPASGAKPSSATSKWSAFFQTAVNKAQTQHARGQLNHPLTQVLRKYDRPKQIADVGASLYSTLSTNIHHFSAQFVVLDDQWNSLEADILRALTPLTRNEGETGVDWEQERLRF